jgi:predicted DNA-binding protein (MmcQ/YjbR family)
MNIEELRDYCLNFKGVTEECPFGPDVLVFKVMGKMFALLPLDTPDLRISLKNSPEINQVLRSEYEFITGAFHMSKVHWNSILIDFSVKKELVFSLVSESYEIVKQGLSKKLKAELEAL